MTGAMCKKIIDLCCANYPNYGEDLKAKGILWMKEFQKYQDDLMYTAILSCFDVCKKFPTVADIKEAIRDLQYEEQIKPKQQLPWGGSWNDPQAKKVFEMANGNRDTKEFLSSIDISKLLEYARIYFPDITPEVVRKNYPELMQGMECHEMCWNCRIDKNACLTQGWIVKHWLHSDGRISNEMAKCQKNN